MAIREKAVWRLLYETAARASEVLSLDVGDVDLENRRAVVRSKGGDLELLHVQTGSARLIAGRTSGPVFLTDRRPAPGREINDEHLARLSPLQHEHVLCSAPSPSRSRTSSLPEVGEGYASATDRLSVCFLFHCYRGPG